MNLDSLKDFISQGIEHGASVSAIKQQALEMGASAQEFDQAYDLIILGDPIADSSNDLPEAVKELAQEPESAPEPEPVKPALVLENVPAQPKEEIIPTEPIVMPRESLAKPVVAKSQSIKSPTPVQIESVAPALKKKGGFFNWFKVHKLAVAVVIVVCLLSGVGYVGATMLMAPNVNEIRGLIFQKLQEMDTVVYQGSIEGEVTTEAAISLESLFKDQPTDTIAKLTSGRVAGSQNTKVRLDFNGAADVRDIDSPKSEFSVTLTASGFVVGLETKSIDDELFLKLTQIPDFGVKEINDLVNQWLRIDYQQIQEEFGGAEATRDEGLTLEQKQRVLRVLSSSNVFKIAERVGSEEINGKATHHYRYMIDEDGLIAMIQELGKIFGSDEEISLEEREAFKEWFDSAGGDIWIAKKDYAPVKMSFEMMMRSVNDAPVSGRLSFDINFNKYNEPVAIEAPYPFKDLGEILKEYQSKASSSTRDARRISDVRQLMTALELYYNDYGSYPRTLDQMTTGQNPLLVELPLAPQPPDGTCTPVQNEYLYKSSLNNDAYTLTFCLGEDSAMYKAGIHTASPSGIK